MIRFQSGLRWSWIDRLNVEDVLRVVGVADVKVRIVLKGDADQIGDRILRGIAQVFSLLRMHRDVAVTRSESAPTANLRKCSSQSAMTLEPHGRAYHRSVYDVVPFEFGSTRTLRKVCRQSTKSNVAIDRDAVDLTERRVVGGNCLP